MSATKGKINVQADNIFPVIKKFLYSDHEIFLRELISNAVDATEKLKTMVSSGDAKVELGDLTIKVELDEKKKQLRIIDRGVGMTAEEIEKYINQIAFSGATEFLEKYKGKDETNIIGHFGLGFYSAFMVADRVDILSKTYKKGKGSKAVKWSCDGSPEFTMEEIETRDRGTTIILHIAEDSEEFLNEHRVLEILKKYSKFVPVPVQFGMEKVFVPDESGEKDEDGKEKTKEVEKPRIINNTNPIWKKAPADLEDKDYKDFYKELYPTQFEDPLFHIHLNVDYPFNLTGILYFPKIKKNIEVQKDKIQLYSNQVFITDEVKDIVPEFLTLLHGVIDSPDIPLNVSRSYLQSDSNVKKISNHIMKKVADKLKSMFKNDRKSFEEKWDSIKVFMQYGILSEEKFYDKANKYMLLKNLDGKYFTFDEYKKEVKENQTDKDKKTVFLYATNEDDQYTYIQTAKDRGYDILIMDGVLDSHFVNHMEQRLENVTFTRVDADTIDNLIKKDEDQPSKLSDDEKEKLKPIFEDQLDKQSYTVEFENLSESDQPVSITQPEFIRRMKDMQEVGGGGMSMYGELPDQYNLKVNTNHPLVAELVGDKKDDEAKKQLAKQMIDLARLSQNLLKGEELAKFIKRSVDIIK